MPGEKSSKSGNDNRVTSDPRFARIHRDPRFKLPKKNAVKEDVDDRFKDLLTKESQEKKATIDKHGRKIEKKDLKKDLSRYYNIEKDESEESEGNASSSESEDESEDESESEAESGEDKAISKRNRMRGEGMSDLSSSEEEDSEDEGDSDNDLEYTVDEYEQAGGEVPQGDATHRFAVVNLDWDNVRAVDLMATFSSFIPKSRRINSVKILPSEYGRKRMAEEELNGPPRDLFDAADKSKEPKPGKNTKGAQVEDNDNGEDYNSSKLRRYQLQRLQYYYAVVDCDSVETASAIYKSCDGTEYESTANFFDLRYVPDEMDFSDKPRDECYKIPNNYQPSDFSTDALNHSKVKLTWDETPKERVKFAARAFNQKEVEDMDVRAYLASDSESDGEGDAAAKYRALIGSTTDDNKDESDVDMEITFNPVLEGKTASLEVVDKKAPTLTEDDNLTTIEKYRLKEKERRRKRMERAKARKDDEDDEVDGAESKKSSELELMMMDDDLTKKASNDAPEPKSNKKLSKRQTKKQALAAAEEDFDIKDSRFQGLFEDPDFAIDSTAPQFKKTKAMEKVLDERRSRSKNTADEPAKKKKKVQPQGEEVASLVAKLKHKNK